MFGAGQIKHTVFLCCLCHHWNEVGSLLFHILVQITLRSRCDSVYRSINDGEDGVLSVTQWWLHLFHFLLLLYFCFHVEIPRWNQLPRIAKQHLPLLDTRGGLEQESVCLFLKPPRFTPPSPCSRESWSEGMTEKWPEFTTWSCSFHCRLLQISARAEFNSRLQCC